jgi:membrane protease YdiL (CAAX protease family)
MEHRALSAATFRSYAVRRPITAFLQIVLPASWILLPALHFSGIPLEAGLLVVNYAGLLGLSALITYWIDGRSGVKHLLGGLLKWRVGLGYYLLALGAIPLVTVATATVAAGFHPPTINWLKVAASLVSGALIINLWEETGWTGFVQSRLMNEKGLLRGSLLTAPAFAGIHLPLLLRQSSWSAAAITCAVLFALAPFFRYLIGMVFIDTGGSLLLVGLLHASFNSSGALGGKLGDGANIIALLCVTPLYAVFRAARARARQQTTLPRE